MSAQTSYESNLSNHNSALYNKNANFVYSDAATGPILSIAQPKRGERILDVGCGTGEVTYKLQSLVGGEGSVWGTDSNEEMLQKLGSRFPSLADTIFQADAQSLELPSGKNLENSFDMVFTSATLHWCKRDPGGVLESVKRCLKPGGRFVGEFGGFMNCCAVRSHLHQILRERSVDPVPLDPWFFPSVKTYTDLLEKHSFRTITCELVPRLTNLPTDLLGWLHTFARNSFLSSFSDEDAEEIMRECAKRCTVDCQDQQGAWSVMYVRLRFEAVLDGDVSQN